VIQAGELALIQAVIFDCDGTLVDSEQAHFLSWQVAIQNRGQTLDKQTYIRHFVGLGDFAILKSLGFSDLDALLHEKNEAFSRHHDDAHIVPIGPTVDFARKLFEQKEHYRLKLAVASGARKEDILRSLKSLGIEHYFEAILSGRDDLSEYLDPEGTNKPKPYVYQKAAKLLGLKPEECLAIEDSSAGVTAATSAGCFTIAIPNHYTAEQDLSHAHMKLKSLEGFSVEHFFQLVASQKRAYTNYRK